MQVSDFNRYIMESVLAGKIDKEVAARVLRTVKKGESTAGEGIAVIGLAFKFPMANTLDEFWEVIASGTDTIRELPSRRKHDVDAYLDFINVPKEDRKYITAGFIDQVDSFDYPFFRLTPREASLMDPGQRLFLQTVWQAIEDAGYGGNQLVGSRTGVYVGYATYPHESYANTIHEIDRDLFDIGTVGNIPALLPSRISHLLDLRGPAILVDTACSSSLVSIHLACQAIRKGECDMALAGGVRVNLMPAESNSLNLGIESQDGVHRTFDEHSTGAASGEGVAAVLLKPVRKALKDGDHIYAVIRGGASNQDGNSISLTAPNPAAQADVLTRAWKDAGIDPQALSYIEVHGSGTRLGDPIEIEGLERAFSQFTERRQFCAISTIKSNTGHLNEAAGIAGFIKALLSLKNRQIPPMARFNRPNSNIMFSNSPVYVNTRLRPWEGTDSPRLCGISSFGLSGTNCHIVLEEAPQQELLPSQQRLNLFTLSAKTPSALMALVKAYADQVADLPDMRLEDVCYTTNTGRGDYNYRLAFTVTNPEDFREKINKLVAMGLEKADIVGGTYGFHQVITDEKSKEAGDLSAREKAELDSKVIAVVEEFITGGKNSSELLENLCALYVAGGDIPWDDLYAGEQYRRVSLPTYPFEDIRCWVEIPDKVAQEDPLDNAFYQMVWREASLHNMLVEDEISEGTVMLLRPANELETFAVDLAAQLRERGFTVIEALTGCDKFRRLSEQVYHLSDNESDYQQLLRAVDQATPLTIFYLTGRDGETLASLADLEEDHRTGVYGLFFLARALGVHEQKGELIVIAPYAQQVTGKEETINPSAMATFGFHKVVQKEYPNLRYRRIDIDTAMTATDLIREWIYGKESTDVAYRRGVRYESEFTAVDLRQVPDRSVTIQEDGVYLITGGTGGIGLEMARYLATKAPVKLALINRSPLPDRSEWEQIADNVEHKLQRKIKTLLEIEALGAEINFYSGNVADLERMEEICGQIRDKYGCINGVIHAAGLPQYELLSSRTPNQFSWDVFVPKVYGTWVMDRVTQHDNLDFFILFSSVATLFAAAGQGEYVAGNAFVDAFTAWRECQGKSALAINWTTWSETGMSFEGGYVVDTIFKVMPTDIGMKWFSQILSKELSNVLAGKLNSSGGGLFLLDKSQVKLSPELRQLVEEHKSSSGREAQGERKAAKTDGKRISLSGEDNGNYTEIEHTVAKVCMDVLGLDDIDVYNDFFEYSSFMLQKIHQKLETIYPGCLTITDMFEYSNISLLAKHISHQLGEEDSVEVIADHPQEDGYTGKVNDDIAIIGMSARFPGCDSLKDFWTHIRSGSDLTGKVPDSRMEDIEQFLFTVNKEFRDGVKLAEGAYLDQIDKFDYRFFRLSPREAALMDPNHRMALTIAWEAVEDAGYGGGKIEGSSTGVYFGVASHVKDTYSRYILEWDPMSLGDAELGNTPAALPGRISYLMNLKGPSLMLDTACSSSLMAIHQAVRGLRNGDCEMALAGSVKLFMLPVAFTEEYETAGIGSSDGKTRTFDNLSDGTSLGEGVAAVLLKPLQAALRDGDNIHAVIKGTAVNQDGTSAGLAAPNPASQKEMLLKAWDDADVNPETISYIEAHGTATALGDPIEIRALSNAFSQHTTKRNFCAVSSVKSNMGHLSECAGMAGLVKAVLAMKNKELPRGINFQRPNEEIDFINSPLYVNTRPQPWEINGHPRRCGVSAFGIGGTNCHVVLEESPAVESEPTNCSQHVLTLSAKTLSGLKTLVKRYLDEDLLAPFLDLEDVCYTANTGRGHYEHRLTLLATNLTELREKLKELRVDILTDLKAPWFTYGYHRVVPSDRAELEPGDLTKKVKKKLDSQAISLVEEYVSSGKANKELLAKICKLYVSGADIPWDKFYEGEKRCRVSLPTYPFEESRCWLNPPLQKMVKEEPALEIENSLFYAMEWREEKRPSASVDGRGKRVLLLLPTEGHGSPLVEQMAGSLRKIGFDVIEAPMPEIDLSEKGVYASTALENVYLELLEKMVDTEHLHILHMATFGDQHDIASRESLESSQVKGMLSLYQLVRAFSKQNVVKSAEILLVSENVYEVTGREYRLNPQYATLFGLAKVVGQEYSSLQARCIDVDADTPPEKIAMELLSADRMDPVAYRNGRRYVQEMVITDPNPTAHPVEIREGGLYLITGGTGGIGLSLARYLSSKERVRLALIGRSQIPERAEWDRILADGVDSRLCAIIQAIREIENTGSEVLYFSADVSREEEMKPIIESLRTEYGRINGVVHCAGIAGANILIQKDLEKVMEVVNPKVQGTWLVDSLTEQDDLDFFVMCSSVVTLTGEASQGDYTAANSFQDAYTAYRNRNGRKTLTINWVAWRDVGMAVEFEVNVDGIFKALPTEVAVNAFDQVLHSSLNQVIIGEFNMALAAQVDALVDLLPHRVSDQIRGLFERARDLSKTHDSEEVAVIEDGRLAVLPRATMSKLHKASSASITLKGKEKERFSEVEKKLSDIYCEVLGYQEINIHDTFFDLGGDSILLARVHSLVEKEFPGKVRLIDLFEYTSVAKLASYIQGSTDEEMDLPVKLPRDADSESRNGDVAIIGLAFDFPGISNMEELYDIVFNGVDCLRNFPASRRADTDRYLQFLRKNNRDGLGIVKGDAEYATGAYLDDVAGFDHKFFRIPPKEASLMDPSQRLFLEVTWRAIEDAGYVGRIEGTKTGVWVGYAANPTYQLIGYDVGEEMVAEAIVGNMANMMSGRVSYLLNLNGPGMVIDTACSSSLVAIHLACQSLRAGECDMAIAGAVKLHLLPQDNSEMQVGFETVDGYTRTFDETASGSAHGEGVATLILKPLEQAEHDGDHIYGVIKGSAVNQDGQSMSLTAPNPSAQAEVITRAWSEAGIDPEQICYLEAHGTATPLGDPIEIDALQRVFAKYTDRKQFCAIGSIKANMGHLFECAGMAGLLKALLVLKHRQIPPTIHFERPNQKIDFALSPLYVNTIPRPVETEGAALVTVSSFGLNGTNSHVVLEEYREEQSPVKDEQNGGQILPLSTKSKEGLIRLVNSYLNFLRLNAGKVRLTDIVGTAATGRGHYEHRLALIVRNLDELQTQLEQISVMGIPEDNPKILYSQHKVVAEGKPVRTSYEITEKEKTELTRQAEIGLERLQENQEDLSALEELGRLYVKGAEVDWDKVFFEVGFRRLSLPSYPFERSHHWLQIPDVEVDVEIVTEAAEEDDSIFYEMKWQEVSLHKTPREDEMREGTVVLLRPANELQTFAADLGAQLRERGLTVIEALTGCDQFRQQSEQYHLGDNEDDYQQLLQAVDQKLPLTIFYLTGRDGETLASLADLEEDHRSGVYGLYCLVRALGAQERAGELIIVANNAQRVTGEEETINPSAVATFGLHKVVQKEYQGLRYRRVDMDTAMTATDLIHEWIYGQEGLDVAYRKGVRYESEFSAIDVHQVPDRSVVIREGGVYLITGGTGGIGLEIAKYLATQAPVRLALINRSSLPNRSEWEQIADNVEHKLHRKIKTLLEIEALGAEINLYSGNVADPERMEEICGQIRDRYGCINGVIHSAGISRHEPIATRQPNAFIWEQFTPKVYGTWVMDYVTRHDNLDFFILFSSVATFFAAAGQGEYVAGNAFQDAFAAWRNLQGRPTLTINWTTWSETGMSFEGGFTVDTIFKVVPTATGVNWFSQILSKELSNVLVGRLNSSGGGLFLLEKSQVKLSPELYQLVEEYKSRSGRENQGGRKAAKLVKEQGITLAGRDDGNYTEEERTIARIVIDVLGLDHIDIYDNFFEMGAESIALQRIHNRIDEIYPGCVTMIDMFQFTSVETLASHICNRQ